MHFMLSTVDTMPMALVCFLHRLPIDLFFLLSHRLEKHYIILCDMYIYLTSNPSYSLVIFDWPTSSGLCFCPTSNL